jgi:hypothetical protein
MNNSADGYAIDPEQVHRASGYLVAEANDSAARSGSWGRVAARNVGSERAAAAINDFLDVHHSNRHTVAGNVGQIGDLSVRAAAGYVEADAAAASGVAGTVDDPQGWR